MLNAIPQKYVINTTRIPQEYLRHTVPRKVAFKVYPKSFEISPQSLPNDPKNTPKRVSFETLEATFSLIPREAANSFKNHAQREPKEYPEEPAMAL